MIKIIQITRDERDFLEREKNYKMHKRIYSTYTRHKKFYAIEDKRTFADLDEYRKRLKNRNIVL